MNIPDRHHEDTQREFDALRKLLEATAAKVDELEAEVVELRAGHYTEPWLDYKQLAKHFSMGETGRTVQEWKRQGMPMELKDGKQKGLLSQILPWLAENGHEAYLPPGYGSGTIVDMRRAA